MDTNMSYKEGDALLSKGEDFGSSSDSVPKAKIQEHKKETQTSQRSPST